MTKNTSKKSFILLLFILLSTFNYTAHGEKMGPSLVKDNHVQVPSITGEVTTIRLSDEKRAKITKKDLKDEIKRRKRHHKALLSIYNENFDENYLNMIADNSKKLTDLRQLLQS